MKELDYTYKDTWKRRHQNLNGMSYGEYLKSDEWKDVKYKTRKRPFYNKMSL